MTDAELRARLLELVRRIKSAEGGVEVQDRLVDEFVRLAPHPQATNFIFWADLPDRELVDRVMAYRPIELPGPPPLDVGLRPGDPLP